MPGWAGVKWALAPWAAMGPSGSFVVLPTVAVPRAATPVRAIGKTGDYAVVASTGALKAGDAIDEEVITRIGTVRGTLVGEPTFGNAVTTNVRIATDGAPVQVEREVLLALGSMLDRGVLKNVRVEVKPFTRNGTTVNAYAVSYTKVPTVEPVRS